MKSINLGKKSGSDCCEPMPEKKSSKVHYPTLYVSGVEGADELPEGEFTFTGKARVVSKTETTRDGKENCSCEIEIMEMGGFAASGKKTKSLEEDLDEMEEEKETFTD
jgi:hypothetical protein